MSALYPMDTAPKDGREVVLQVKLRAGIRGKYLVGHYMPGGHCIADHPPIEGGWYFWNGCMFDRAAEPVGWMPIPGEEYDFPVTDLSGLRPAISFCGDSGKWRCSRPDSPETVGTGKTGAEAYQQWRGMVDRASVMERNQ